MKEEDVETSIRKLRDCITMSRAGHLHLRKRHSKEDAKALFIHSEGSQRDKLQRPIFISIVSSPSSEAAKEAR